MATESFFSSASLAYLASAGAGKDGKAYSIKPTDGTGDFTFSRGSNLTATRVGPTGLIEKGRENLLTYSNQFDTNWGNGNTTETSGQSGYDGSNNAWLLEKNPVAFSYINQNLSASGVVTFSVYAKANTLSEMNLRISTGARAVFDLANGTTSSQLAKITDVGNGWYRCEAAFVGTISSVRIYPDWEESDAGSIYIQDAQVEIGLAATDYIESGATTGKAGLLEDEPRFDYSGGATCPSLLLEPSRTQLLPYSEYYNGSGYNLESSATLDLTLYESPEGVNNAYKLNLPSLFSRITHPSQYIGAHTFSVWMRADTSGTISLRCATGNPAVSEQKNVTTQWQRFDITATDGNYWQVIRNSGDTLSSVYIYGHQIEAGSYPTSYIPNHSGGTITRGDDYAFFDSASSIIGQNEGTVYVNAKNLNEAQLLLINRSTTNSLCIFSAQNSVRFFVFNNTVVHSYNSGVSSIDEFKAVIKYDSSAVKFFINGSLVQTYSAWDLATPLVDLRLNDRPYITNPGLSELQQILLLPNALSDADCIALTS